MKTHPADFRDTLAKELKSLLVTHMRMRLKASQFKKGDLIVHPLTGHHWEVLEVKRVMGAYEVKTIDFVGEILVSSFDAFRSHLIFRVDPTK